MPRVVPQSLDHDLLRLLPLALLLGAVVVLVTAAVVLGTAPMAQSAGEELLFGPMRWQPYNGA